MIKTQQLKSLLQGGQIHHHVHLYTTVLTLLTLSLTGQTVDQRVIFFETRYLQWSNVPNVYKIKDP